MAPLIRPSGKRYGYRSLKETESDAPYRAVAAVTSCSWTTYGADRCSQRSADLPQRLTTRSTDNCCAQMHHADKTEHEAKFLAADDAMSASDR